MQIFSKLNNLKVGTKLLFVFLAIGIVAIGAIGTIGYNTAKNSLEEEAFNKLTAVREMKASQIEAYFQQIRDQGYNLF